MKTLFVVIALSISTVIFPQNPVDISLSTPNDSTCLLELNTNLSNPAILSNVVFTLQWKSCDSITFGRIQTNANIEIAPSGATWQVGNYNYQVFSGCGLTTSDLSKSTQIRISKMGQSSSAITLANSDLVDQLMNGSYYVSVGGVDVTGKQLFVTNNNKSTQRVLYFDPNSRQLLIEVNGQFTNMLGQRVKVREINLLQKIQYSNKK